MNLIESLLDVLALIGIILTGGFLVFFLGDLLLSVLDPSYGSIFKRRKNKEKQDDKPVVKEPEQTSVVEKAPVVEPIPAQTEEKAAVNDIEEEEKITFNDFDNLNDFDDAEALKEQQMLEGAEAFSRDDAMAELKAEEERFKQEQLAQALARQQAMAEQKEEQNVEEQEFDLDSIFVEDDEDEDLADFNFDEIEEQAAEVEESVEEETEEPEVAEEPAEELIEEPEQSEEVAVVAEQEQPEEAVEEATEEVSEEVEPEVEEVEDEEVVEDSQPDEETLALMAEIERLKAELEAAKAQPAEVEIKTVVNNMTEEDCLAKLDELKARLKANEKEFKQAKKEFLPLRKIMKTLDNDKKKLRRKEAIVAKQKVVLYGVNNVVDIDQEKAQKLAEDLDLLDGLRLSVQHCEEVIKNNEERIPLLEKNYNILLQENANIKADIASMEELLKTFQTVETTVEANDVVEDKPEETEGTENN